MRYNFYEHRMMPYGNLKITIHVAKDGYMPTNEEVSELAREIFGLPTRKEYERLDVRLYWHQNIRIFECIIDDIVVRKRFGRTYDYDAYELMGNAAEAGYASGWIATAGNSMINKVFGISLVKVVE